MGGVTLREISMSLELTCRRCAYTGPVTDFPRNRNVPSGYNATCKPCTVKATREWKARNPERSREHSRKQYALERQALIESGQLAVPPGGCYACARVKPDSQFVTSKGKRRNICKQCANRRQREWFREHPEVRRTWQRRNRDKVRAAHERWNERHPGAQEESQKRAYDKIRADPKKRRFWTNYYKQFMRLRRANDAPSEVMLLNLVEKCVSGLPDDVREAAQQDLFVRVLDHEVGRSELRPGTEAVKSAISRAYLELPNREHRSLDASVKTGTDGELTWADWVEDDTDYGVPEW